MQHSHVSCRQHALVQDQELVRSGQADRACRLKAVPYESFISPGLPCGFTSDKNRTATGTAAGEALVRLMPSGSDGALSPEECGRASSLLTQGRATRPTTRCALRP